LQAQAIQEVAGRRVKNTISKGLTAAAWQSAARSRFLALAKTMRRHGLTLTGMTAAGYAGKVPCSIHYQRISWSFISGVTRTPFFMVPVSDQILQNNLQLLLKRN